MLLIKRFLIESSDSEIAYFFFSFDAKTTAKGVQKFSPICLIILLDRYFMKNTALNQIL